MPGLAAKARLRNICSRCRGLAPQSRSAHGRVATCCHPVSPGRTRLQTVELGRESFLLKLCRPEVRPKLLRGVTICCEVEVDARLERLAVASDAHEASWTSRSASASKDSCEMPAACASRMQRRMASGQPFLTAICKAIRTSSQTLTAFCASLHTR